ncbi:hypothetical protein [Kineosporia sp. NBRC 101731]|uniref:alpha/beta fold hydrolase n=1 Tax=Kineosporia sp. NBRC 101731 TaxID=3032199 RepID=UPI0024A06DE4|nr:hypothetical protein [Kineosporia sp. NBRC 101731]GLY30400.1 hypothetical protein Kisp02_37650 [Kineosporia sp. NBRC 101731]
MNSDGHQPQHGRRRRRSAALTDLPEPEKLAGLPHPALILTFPDDPGHPLSTATALESLLPGATLYTPASRPADVAAWGAVVSEFLTA